MAVRFGPLGDSKLFSVSSTSARTALPTLPTDATKIPAVALVSLQPLQAVWWVKFGDNTVTATAADAIRCEPGSKEKPLILPVVGSPTHIAILAEGEPGNLVLTSGELVIGDFSPSGTGSEISVTASSQAIALPTLPSTRPTIALVGMQSLMEAVWVKFGSGAVSGSISTSMRVFPGSSDAPTLLQVPSGATHMAIFCDGQPGGVMMTPGSMVLRKVSATADIIMSASPRILGLDTGHPAAAKELTLSQVLDFIGSAAQGDILYRGASAWARLGAGTNGQFLQTQGAAANPQWATADGDLRYITSGALSASASLDITVPANCNGLEIELHNWVPATDNQLLALRFSQSGSFLSGASDYAWGNYRGGNGISSDTADNEIEVATVWGNAAAELGSIVLRILDIGTSGVAKSAVWHGYYTDTAGNPQALIGGGRMIANTNAIDGVRLIYASGNISSGRYVVRAYSNT